MLSSREGFAISVFSGNGNTGPNKENLSWEGEEFSFAHQFRSVLIISMSPTNSCAGS